MSIRLALSITSSIWTSEATFLAGVCTPWVLLTPQPGVVVWRGPSQADGWAATSESWPRSQLLAHSPGSAVQWATTWLTEVLSDGWLPLLAHDSEGKYSFSGWIDGFYLLELSFAEPISKDEAEDVQDCNQSVCLAILLMVGIQIRSKYRAWTVYTEIYLFTLNTF